MTRNMHPAVARLLALSAPLLLIACAGDGERESRQTVEARLNEIQELKGTISDEVGLGYESRIAAPAEGGEDVDEDFRWDTGKPRDETKSSADSANVATNDSASTQSVTDGQAPGPGFEVIAPAPADTREGE